VVSHDIQATGASECLWLAVKWSRGSTRYYTITISVFSTLLPVSTEFLDLVIFLVYFVILRFYGIHLQYSNRVYLWLNLTSLFGDYFTTLPLVSTASNGRITDELERMWKETVMVLSRFYLICSGHRETPENLRITCNPPEIRKEYPRNTNL
jgi:hypothetical protein